MFLSSVITGFIAPLDESIDTAVLSHVITGFITPLDESIDTAVFYPLLPALLRHLTRV